MSIGENDGAKAPLLNVANVLTVLRLILVPVFVAVYWSDTPVRSALAWFVFALAAATDKADGYLARSRGLITDFGKMADSLADKAARSTYRMSKQGHCVGSNRWWDISSRAAGS